MLIEKFICWDSCPDVGMVFLLYQGVESAEACPDAVVGTPLISPEPMPGEYWGCRPVVDWLDRSDRPPGDTRPSLTTRRPFTGGGLWGTLGPRTGLSRT